MLIILTGPDGSGKSTLAKRLSAQTGYPIQHRHKPKDQAEKDAMMEMYINLIETGADVILDRAWYCEMVYGDIMRDKSYISMGQMYELEYLVSHNGGGIVIHCTDETNKLWDRCMKRGEEYIQDYETLANIKDKYEWLMHFVPHTIPVVRYSINENLPEVWLGIS